MMIALKAAGKGHKRIEIRIFAPGNKDSKLHIIQAQPGHAYAEEQIERILENFAENVEIAAPEEEYELVEVGPARFNFVWRGRKPASADRQISDER